MPLITSVISPMNGSSPNRAAVVGGGNSSMVAGSSFSDIVSKEFVEESHPSFTNSHFIP